jgi:hypothetical protein
MDHLFRWSMGSPRSRSSCSTNISIRPTLEIVRAFERRFHGFTLKYIPRAENVEADELAKAAANNIPTPEGVFFQELKLPATTITQRAFKEILITESEDWRQLIIDQINSHYRDQDEASAARMAARARSYTLVDGVFYKKGVVQPLLGCIAQSEGKELLREVHAGIYGSHIGPRALLAKVIRQGFYWPTHLKDVEEIVRTCKACQSNSTHQAKPSAPTQLIPPIWPMQRWGMDLVGPLPHLHGGNKFAIVAVEYFTRWIGARSLTTITSRTVKKFFRQNTVCRFRVPRILTVQ